jgi:hypothetical protein
VGWSRWAASARAVATSAEVSPLQPDLPR